MVDIYFICDNIPTKAILFFVGCSEVNSTWLITSEQANQRARKVLFTCVQRSTRPGDGVDKESLLVRRFHFEFQWHYALMKNSVQL